MNLSEVFAAVAHKQLVLVDLPAAGSHQHELNGVSALKDFFGTSGPTKGRLTWHYFADEQEPVQELNDFTFYDARAKTTHKTGRTEWRMYYYGDFLNRAGIGDLIVLAKTRTDEVHGLVFQERSSWLRAAKELFALHHLDKTFSAVPKSVLESQQLEFLRQQILEELELGVALPVAPSDEELMLRTFGHAFPVTKEMSRFARTQVEVDHRYSDESLSRWIEREEELFRALENVIIRERLAKNFATVDEFIEYSLSVQNRRKSRMGFALQNHLAELFTRHGLRFTAQARTEVKSRPDFIFPGEVEYHDPEFNAALLVMLGVKSSSKERWRQVLPEADRIPHKHLCTLEAGISTSQTDEMLRQRLTLVVPSGLHPTYTTEQRRAVLSVAQFIEFTRSKQT